MTPEELEKLFERYLNGTCSAKERALVDKFFASYSGKLEKGDMGSMDAEAVRDELHRRIRHEIREEKPGKERSLRYMWRLAAAIVVGVALSAMATLIYRQFTTEDQAALLTRATQRGERATVELGDGTRVYLNSQSELVYPEAFGDDHRKVVLKGEAFFEVTRDEEKPFIVVSNEVTTRVLGTSFNVSAFPDEDIKVTVASGKVQVVSGENESKELLLPNQQAVYDPSSKVFHKTEFDAAMASGWKDGVLILDNITLEDASEILEQWYDVDISFENEAMKGCMIRVKYRNETLANVLDGWKHLLGVDYEVVNENTVVLSGGRCVN